MRLERTSFAKRLAGYAEAIDLPSQPVVEGRLLRMVGLTLEAEGLRDKFVVCCGGPRITHELAKELGYDAGFGAGKYADDVASFAVTEMVKRGMK